ncbi:MAG: discoidin domain-containing protein [Bacteroidales bacterium]|nr:discoidin domain-containing protein [Bacteroidales bacterium]
MKKLLYSIFAIAAIAAAAVSCSKESESAIQAPRTRTVTITAGLPMETRTAYDGEGKFSWVEGDRIGVVVSNGTEKKVVAFTTATGGSVAEFTGQVEENYEPTGIATYPFTEAYEGYACNDFAYDPEKDGYRIWGSVKPSIESPLASNPLTGIPDQYGVFQFRSAMGVVKFTIENLPAETAYAYLEIPSDADGYLNGWFSINEEGTVTMAGAVEGWKDRYNWNVPTAAGETLDYYFFTPVGTIPAGLKVEVCNSSYEAIESFVTVQPIEVIRNTVTNVAAIRMPDPPSFSLDEVLGTYQMKATAGPYSSNNAVGECVFEASDDPSKGNVMITKFAGISGKQYGTLSGTHVVFDKDQLFAANPYEATAADYPYIAIDAYQGGVIDLDFEVLEAHYLKFVGDALGFRATTEDKWYNDSHNGAWPWSLCFKTVELKPEWPEEAPDLEPGQVWLKESMVTAVGTCTWGDGTGIPGAIDNDPSTYWHSDYYYAITGNDPVYGLYFQIELETALQKFHFVFITRSSNSNAAPTHIVYGVSEDGTTWTKLDEEETGVTTSTGGGVTVTLKNLDAGAEYKYLRFGITESTDAANYPNDSFTGDINYEGYKKSVNLADLKLFAD